MALTGYEISIEASNETVGMCPSCGEELGIDADARNVREHDTQMFRHGSGAARPCLACGLDVNDALAKPALAGDVDRAKVEAEPAPSLDAVARVLSMSEIDCIATISLAPGVDAERVPVGMTENGEVFAEYCRQPDDAPRTLHVRLMGHDATDKELGARADRVTDLLDGMGLRTTVIPADDRDPDWVVLGVTEA